MNKKNTAMQSVLSRLRDDLLGQEHGLPKKVRWGIHLSHAEIPQPREPEYVDHDEHLAYYGRQCGGYDL